MEKTILLERLKKFDGKYNNYYFDIDTMNEGLLKITMSGNNASILYSLTDLLNKCDVDLKTVSVNISNLTSTVIVNVKEPNYDFDGMKEIKPLAIIKDKIAYIVIGHEVFNFKFDGIDYWNVIKCKLGEWNVNIYSEKKKVTLYPIDSSGHTLMGYNVHCETKYFKSDDKIY